jgi:putative ABC transport system ATP-binding protein
MTPPSVTAVERRVTRPPGPLVIEIEGVTKLYKMGAETIHALRGVALTIRRNE